MDKSVAAEEQGAQFCKDREISMALFGLQRMGKHRDIYSFDGGSTVTAQGAQYISSELRRYTCKIFIHTCTHFHALLVAVYVVCVEYSGT
jgi:hypothetical protein